LKQVLPAACPRLAVAQALGGGRGGTAATTLALAAVVAAPIAALPAGETGQVIVMFRPGMEGAPAFNALAAADARVLWVYRPAACGPFPCLSRRVPASSMRAARCW